MKIKHGVGSVMLAALSEGWSDKKYSPSDLINFKL